MNDEIHVYNYIGYYFNLLFIYLVQQSQNDVGIFGKQILINSVNALAINCMFNFGCNQIFAAP